MSHSSCPACFATDPESFYLCRQVPVHTTLLMTTRKLALDYPRRDIELVHCPRCGFISNRLFEPGIHHYSSTCEESQGCSPTFSNWLKGIAQRLINDYKISKQKVFEIGSGKGEFLAQICSLGGNSGIGYDPAYVTGRLDETADHIDFRTEMWKPRHGIEQADVVVCRHTLEHIPGVHDFLRDIRIAIGDNLETLLFFEVPDVLRVLEEVAFWDIYYEHCSYFSKDSLCALFRLTGYDILECWLDYDDQYIMLVAKPAAETPLSGMPLSAQPLRTTVNQFRSNFAATRAKWIARLETYARTGTSVILWGGGSKAAAFLNQVDLSGSIRKVIDINPHKQGCFIPGSGQEVVGPGFLKQETPGVIILMNSIYRSEVQQYLDKNQHDVQLLWI